MKQLLEDTIERLLSDGLTPEWLRQSEEGVWHQALWSRFEQAGFSLALVPQSCDGIGLEWDDIFPIALAAGRHNLPLPLLEDMVARQLLANTGVPAPEGMLTWGDVSPELVIHTQGATTTLTGSTAALPWGRHATHALLQVETGAGPQLALLALEGLRWSQDANLAREPRDRLHLDAVEPLAMVAMRERHVPSLRLCGALLRSAQMAGAMQRLLTQSTQYVSERSQFGKPIGQFQAIQQQLAVLGCEAAAAQVAAAYAFASMGSAQAPVAVAAAKSRISVGAGTAASIAHAIHGAIGFTYEHSLHFATRRLWSWRAEFGHAAWWNGQLGKACLSGESSFWDGVTNPSQLVMDCFAV